MTKQQLHDIIKSRVIAITLYRLDEIVELIWGQPFDGETEKITPQPISTAPSGQRILLYCKRPIESEGWWQIGLLCTDIGKFIDDDSEPNWLLVQPSYWMPLPQPPQPQ
jgi:hypothetical protein